MGLAVFLYALIMVVAVVMGILLGGSIVFGLIALIRKIRGKTYKGFLITSLVFFIPLVLMIVCSFVHQAISH